MNPAVFLDRDGILVRASVRDGKPFAPRSLAEFELLPDAQAAVTLLKEAGFRLVVVTNQPDVGNGMVDRRVVVAMHDRLSEALSLDRVKTCFHGQSANCDCRKPRPGMLIEAAEELDISLSRSFMVGDRWSDVAAGAAKGCRTVFVDRGYAEPKPVNASVTVSSTLEAANWILDEACAEE